MILLNVEKGLECELHVDVIHLERVAEFKYLGSILDKSSTDGAEERDRIVKKVYAGECAGFRSVGKTT